LWKGSGLFKATGLLGSVFLKSGRVLGGHLWVEKDPRDKGQWMVL
jgi:hypothetical protein